MASGRDSGGLGGGIVASGCDSTGLRGGIEGFGRVGCGTRLLACILGSNVCKAFRLVFDRRSRQRMQVAKTLLPGLAEASARKEESKSFCRQPEQYLESISGGSSKERGKRVCLEK